MAYVPVCNLRLWLAWLALQRVGEVVALQPGVARWPGFYVLIMKDNAGWDSYLRLRQGGDDLLDSMFVFSVTPLFYLLPNLGHRVVYVGVCRVVIVIPFVACVRAEGGYQECHLLETP